MRTQQSRWWDSIPQLIESGMSVARACGATAIVAGASLLLVGCDVESSAGVSPGEISSDIPAPRSEETNEPLIRFEPSELDLGIVYSGRSAEGTVRLVNDSEHAVRITRTSTSCRCTVVRAPMEVIEPGESAEVSVRYKPGGTHGATSRKTISFVLDGAVDFVRLPVTAQVAELIRVSPDRISVGESELPAVTLESFDETPFRVLSAEPDVFVTSESKAQLVHELKFDDAKCRALGMPANVRIRTTHPEEPVVSLRMRAAVPVGRAHRDGQPQRSERSAEREPYVKPLQASPRRAGIGSLAQTSHADLTIFLPGVYVTADSLPSAALNSDELAVEVVDWRQESGGVRVTCRFRSASGSASRLQIELHVMCGGSRGTVSIYGSIE